MTAHSCVPWWIWRFKVDDGRASIPPPIQITPSLFHQSLSPRLESFWGHCFLLESECLFLPPPTLLAVAFPILLPAQTPRPPFSLNKVSTLTRIFHNNLNSPKSQSQSLTPGFVNPQPLTLPTHLQSTRTILEQYCSTSLRQSEHHHFWTSANSRPWYLRISRVHSTNFRSLRPSLTAYQRSHNQQLLPSLRLRLQKASLLPLPHSSKFHRLRLVHDQFSNRDLIQIISQGWGRHERGTFGTRDQQSAANLLDFPSLSSDLTDTRSPTLDSCSARVQLLERVKATKHSSSAPPLLRFFLQLNTEGLVSGPGYRSLLWRVQENWCVSGRLATRGRSRTCSCTLPWHHPISTLAVVIATVGFPGPEPEPELPESKTLILTQSLTKIYPNSRRIPSNPITPTQII